MPPSFIDTGNSAPTRNGYLGDPQTAPPNFGPQGVGASCPSKQSSFEGKQMLLIPFAEWSAGGKQLNKPVNMRGRSITFGFFGDSIKMAGGVIDPVLVIHFKQFTVSQLVQYARGDATAGGTSAVTLPPSEMANFGTGLITVEFEDDFEQFYFSLDATGFAAGDVAGDLVIMVSPCTSSVRFKL